MGELMNNFLHEEDGMGTVEVVMIIAALIAIAVVFRTSVSGLLPGIIETVLNGITEK